MARFALQRKGLPLTGLPSKLALVAAFLVALFGMAGGAAPAAAHGTHANGVASERSSHHRQSSELLGVPSRSGEAHAVSVGQDPPFKAPDPSRSSDSCCGSAVCHAGVTFAVTVLILPEPKGVRVKTEPSFGREQRAPSGLERPPRCLRAI